MQKIFLFFLIPGCILPLFSDTIPGIPYVEQEHYKWCWAAVTQCMLEYYIPGFSATQSEVASVFTTKDTSPAPEEIPEIIEKNSTSNGIKAILIDRPLTWDEMKTEAELKQPFIIIINWFGGGYHCVVFAGYLGDDDRNIKCMDPIMRWTYSSYEDIFKVDHGNGQWGATIKLTVDPGAIRYSRYLPRTSNDLFEISESSGYPTVSFFGNPSGRLWVYAMDGSIVYKCDLNEREIKLNNLFASGSYLLNVMMNSNGPVIYSNKIVYVTR